VSGFALFYYLLAMNTPRPLNGMEAVLLSLTAFHGRVFSMNFPLDTPQAILTACETILGLLMEGVFIAMLTQRLFGYARS
jgi:hypothetical protein